MSDIDIFGQSDCITSIEAQDTLWYFPKSQILKQTKKHSLLYFRELGLKIGQNLQKGILVFQ